MSTETERLVIKAIQDLAHKLGDLCPDHQDYIDALGMAVDDLAIRKEAAEEEAEG
jgi:hypothetical protein